MKTRLELEESLESKIKLQRFFLWPMQSFFGVRKKTRWSTLRIRVKKRFRTQKNVPVLESAVDYPGKISIFHQPN